MFYQNSFQKLRYLQKTNSSLGDVSIARETSVQLANTQHLLVLFLNCFDVGDFKVKWATIKLLTALARENPTLMQNVIQGTKGNIFLSFSRLLNFQNEFEESIQTRILAWSIRYFYLNVLLEFNLKIEIFVIIAFQSQFLKNI